MFVRLLKRFVDDERGIFAVIFGVMAIVLTAMAGAVVDYVTLDQVRNRAQIALDAAALALQPEIYTLNNSTLQAKAEALLTDRIGDESVTAGITSVVVDTTNGRLTLNASLTVPMNFVALVGINEMTTLVVSQVTRKKLYIEVAFVLDNSGSMSDESRMTNLKSATNCANNILFYGTCTPAAGATKNLNTKVSVVPFNFFVNVGSSNSGKSWIDKNGVSSIANDNFNQNNDGSSFNGPVDRLALFDSMNNVNWAGCVEDRPYPYSVNDATPTASTPDTLFVPEFAPDEPGNANSYPNYYYDTFLNSYINDYPSGSQCDVTQGTCTCSVTSYTYNCGTWWRPRTCTGTTTTCSYVKADGTTASCSCSGGLMSCPVSYTPTGLTDRPKQERTCKYSGASPVNIGFDYGPNAGCPATSVLPLTDVVANVSTRVNAMQSAGATNIHQGVAWGFRVLSPTEPFTEGRAYGTATSKVMIVMTDGANTYYPRNNMNGSQIFGPYGHLWNGRVGTYGSETDVSMQTKTDTLTLEACTNAKTAGIVIYTIGLKPPNQTTTNMLTSCASDTSKAYFPTQSSELNTVFASIAEQLSQLRIEK